MITPKFNVKALFEINPVLQAVAKAKKIAGQRIGSFIYTRARQSMRKRKGAAEPGTPPNAHLGGIKNLMRFAFDEGRGTEVIGPIKGFGGEAPPAQEFGGVVTVKGPRGRGRIRVTIRKHPFMGPALVKEIEAGTVPGAWQGTVKR